MSDSQTFTKAETFSALFCHSVFRRFNYNILKRPTEFVAFAGAGALPISSDLFINLAAGLFILPFFLFSASAGVLADKYEKSCSFARSSWLKSASCV